MSESIKKVDFIVLFSVLGLIAMGLVALYSSSFTAMGSGGETNYFLKQLIWTIAGLVMMLIIFFIPNRWIYESAYVLYGISLLMLLAVIFFGSRALGAERWLRIGPASFQPSEFAKIATILAAARFISSEKIDLNKFKDFIRAGLIFFVPFVLIIRQPDLGTAMVFFALAMPMFYWSGLRSGNFFLIIMPVFIVFASFQFYAFLVLMLILVLYLVYSKRDLPVLVLNFVANIFMGLITPVLWSHLKPYQQSRIKIFLNPEIDPKGAGYQIIQSKVAIGSGGFTGSGLMAGTQTQLRFLPEQHSDFIYAVIGEELGFLGVMLGLTLFLVLLLRGVWIASIVKNRFNSIVAVGIITLIAFQMVVNLGMTIGLLPVTGIPLPFISYGGTSLLTNMTLAGVLLNFYKNRYEY